MKTLITAFLTVLAFSLSAQSIGEYCGTSNPLSSAIGFPVEFCGEMSDITDGLIYAVGILDLPQTPERDLHTVNGVLDLSEFKFYGSMTNKGFTQVQNNSALFYKDINGVLCQFGFDATDTSKVAGGFQFGNSNVHIYANSIFSDKDDSIVIETPDTTIVIK